MVDMTFVEANGSEHPVSGRIGQSVMEAAVWNNVPGIEAVCGGALACSTCLVHVSKEWRDKLPAPSASEIDLMSSHSHSRSDSRLSCQLRVCDAINGIVLNMPVAQK
jgi:2Fe-2S ferredoxin